MPLGPQAEALLKKLADSGTQPFETMTLAEGRPELTAPGPNTVLKQTNAGVARGSLLRRAHSGPFPSHYLASVPSCSILVQTVFSQLCQGEPVDPRCHSALKGRPLLDP